MADYSQLLDEAGRQYNVDPALLRAQMQIESGGNPNAKSEKDAAGLMQIIPATQKALGVTDPNDPRQSIFAAARLMSENLDRYGNVADAVKAYHGGTDQSNWGPKTKAYAQNVTQLYSGGAPVPAQKNTADAPMQAAQDFAAQYFGDGSPAPKADAQNFAARYFADDAPAVAAAPGGIAPPQSVPGDTPGQTPQLASVTAQAQDRPQGIGDKIMSVVNGLPQYLVDNTIGGLNGIADVFDAPAEWLAKGMDASGATAGLKSLGIDSGTYDQQVQANKDRRAAYDAQYGNNIGAGAGRLGGQAVATMVPIGGAQALLARGGNALLGAMRGAPVVGAAVPALEAAGNFAAGNSGLLSRAANLGAQGGAAGALMSGGSDVPIEQQMLTGAALGAAVPVVGGALRAGAGVAKGLVQPFTEGGQAAIANNTLSRMAAGGPTTADLTTYVPGSTPTLAQATKNPMLSAMERSMENMTNQGITDFGAVKAANNEARVQFVNSIRGDQTTLAQAIADREAQALPLLATAFAGARPANPTPVLKTIDSILDSHQGQRNAVVDAMNEVKSKIQPGGKQTITDPDQLYGIRKAINDRLDVVAGRDNSVAQQASRELIEVRDALDGAIEKSAPGFGAYLKQYADLSKPVNAQSYLQSLNLTDATGEKIMLGRVKAELDKINKLRAAPGANDAKSISDDQLDALKNLHKDLVRESYSANLGRASGTNTAQNFGVNNLMQSALPGALGRLPLGPETLGGGIGYALGGPIGAAMGVQGGNYLRQAMATANPEIQGQLARMLVDPTTVLARPNGLADNLLLQRLGVGAGNSLRTTGDGRAKDR